MIKFTTYNFKEKVFFEAQANEKFKFVYADMHHSNLKFILNNPLNGKYVNQFRNKNNITNIESAYCEDYFFAA